MSNRRDFIRTAGLAGIGAAFSGVALPGLARDFVHGGEPVKVGVIGLDTEHSVAFTKTFHAPDALPDVAGFRVVAAYPHGSRDIASSLAMIPGFTEEMRKLGVEITGSIEDLLSKVDVVLLETNDGRLHLEQALPVLKAHKPVFIDKPVAASLSDAIAIYDAAKRYGTPLFSSSSLRYMNSVRQIAQGKVGKVTGADAYGPAVMEKTHPDLFWYGIHAVETLFTVMGRGCRRVSRTFTEGTDLVVGVWEDGRIGTMRGLRTGAHDFGGTAFGDKGIAAIGPWEGYRPLVVEIATFFRTGQAPVSPEETLEIFAFMEAADQSRRKGGAAIELDRVMREARKAARRKEA